MLTRIEDAGQAPMTVKIGEAKYPQPFTQGLEYNPPVRGVWNIVHTGMLVPQAHQIFACAQGCLRGVILTAAEMNALDRMSWIALQRSDLISGSMENDIIDGVTQILNGLPKMPRAVLLFLSCPHLFAGCDFELILTQLRERFESVDFTDCYMTPTMRKTISPDAKMRIQLYSLLKPLPVNERAVNIIGCDRPTDKRSELVSIIEKAGFELRDITLCESYDEYLKMAESRLNISYLPTARAAGERLAQRLGTTHLYLPVCFDFDEITKNYQTLCESLGIEKIDFTNKAAQAQAALESAHEVIADTPVAVDFTAVSRPFELALMLCRSGFNVRYIFADAVSAEEHESFKALAEEFPDIRICSVVSPEMLYFDAGGEKILAIGQKAAYYCQTGNFVNIVSNGGFYGFSGICSLCGLLEDAYKNEKPLRETIRLKGLGCESCL